MGCECGSLYVVVFVCCAMCFDGCNAVSVVLYVFVFVIVILLDEWAQRYNVLP